MRLYYSGSSIFNGEQKDYLKSLGGYPSNSPVPNGRLQSIFSNITREEIDTSKGSECFLLVLKNTTGITLNDLELYVEYPLDEEDNNISAIKLEFAAVMPALDDCGDFIFERINNSDELPLFGDFIDADGASNALQLGDLGANDIIGIWVKRTVIASQISLFDCERLYGDFILNNESVEDLSIRLIIRESSSISGL